MRDFRDAKVMARALRDALKTKTIETTHTEALELIAKAFGYENWNILSAKIEEAEPSASAKAPGSDDGSPSVEALLVREANHRARNILSVVQAIAHHTKASSVQEFIARFDERIRSLKASHDLLVKTKWNIPLAEVVRAQLAHFGPILDSRIIVRGPDLMITPLAAQAIGMAIHEMATNAGKYGALSNDTGHVNIAWGLGGLMRAGSALGWTGAKAVVRPWCPRHDAGLAAQSSIRWRNTASAARLRFIMLPRV
jgi:two-component sensor histidine kinase